jgi:pimeloyl-ACP methyl ester carboxylesterase
VSLPLGPFAQIQTLQGSAAPLYLIPFDKKGRCEGPKTLAHMLDAARNGAFSDVHVFSHGWNNVFEDAVGLYREFFDEYFALRARHGISNAGYQPLLVGIIWPSTALVSDAERGPVIAGGSSGAELDASFAEGQMSVRELASEIADVDVERFYELANLDRPLTHDEALELARILLPILGRDDATGEEIPQQATVERIVKAWEKTSLARPVVAAGGAGIGGAGSLPDDDDAVAPAAPAAAGFFDFLNPREIIRKATVYQMKDRAGTVGAFGVGPMLKQLLAIDGRRIHLMGHSFGGKVVLSALTVPAHPRRVESVLLLQPAVNFLCFAEDVDGRQGGYRPAMDRTKRPILSTFSSLDGPLGTFFHLAVRRDGDLAEQRIAAAPSQFAALGGFGPGGLAPGEGNTIEIPAPPTPYPALPAGVKIRALDGSADRITSHGDVRNPFTEWALVNLTI